MKPILFSTPMAKAIKDGRKTVTRRLASVQPTIIELSNWKTSLGEMLANKRCKQPFYPGDVLYVRESWAIVNDQCVFRSDVTGIDIDSVKWKPSIHMKKELARTFLLVEEVYPEMLQEISEEHAKMEGAIRGNYIVDEDGTSRFEENDEDGRYIPGFAFVWNSTVDKKEFPTISWDANPAVWVVKFKVVSEKEAEAYDRLSEMSRNQKIELYDNHNGERCPICIYRSGCEGGVSGGPNGPLYPPCSDSPEADQFIIDRFLDKECFEIIYGGILDNE